MICRRQATRKDELSDVDFGAVQSIKDNIEISVEIPKMEIPAYAKELG